ncbi:hypothetical protein LJF41_06790 [Salmonella enterica subsp. enterica serovar Schwarzengrund]|nr:hypothetical protein LJF41_06790 [Salmonella enterica subsp. enterica serovar Schwarzengrund]UDX17304.1 hypothetical protein LJF42_01680 [Salmonella enterica subsp. enterica serovar Schwarzengrund]UDX28479.1 hypothetical protein LJF40_14405 [Salmonella enterica subsp. enterica serovar Schwarzengrund]
MPEALEVSAEDDTGHFPLTSTRPPLSSLRRRASFSAFASASSFVYLASRAATSRWRPCMSSIVSFASFNLWVAVSRWPL